MLLGYSAATKQRLRYYIIRIYSYKEENNYPSWTIILEKPFRSFYHSYLSKLQLSWKNLITFNQLLYVFPLFETWHSMIEYGFRKNTTSLLLDFCSCREKHSGQAKSKQAIFNSGKVGICGNMRFLSDTREMGGMPLGTRQEEKHFKRQKKVIRARLCPTLNI